MSPVSLTITLAQKPRKIPRTSVSGRSIQWCDGGVAQTCDDPELPEHHKRTTNAVGSHLSGIDRHSGVLRANADTHDEASGKEFLPCSCESGTNWGGGKAQGSNKDFTTTTKIVVHWVDDEGATGSTVSKAQKRPHQ
jgi:hypothetical protein